MRDICLTMSEEDARAYIAENFAEGEQVKAVLPSGEIYVEVGQTVEVEAVETEETGEAAPV